MILGNAQCVASLRRIQTKRTGRDRRRAKRSPRARCVVVAGGAMQ